ncbi:MAG: hypothetical protein LBD82_08060 [Deltaproteobacteria bacterium]|jgi:hypothetical protein|nr:hypothetical protein [Deltaproteobacteria bacterium]
MEPLTINSKTATDLEYCVGALASLQKMLSNLYESIKMENDIRWKRYLESTAQPDGKDEASGKAKPPLAPPAPPTKAKRLFFTPE